MIVLYWFQEYQKKWLCIQRRILQCFSVKTPSDPVGDQVTSSDPKPNTSKVWDNQARGDKLW